jgi:hypothetical protein
MAQTTVGQTISPTRRPKVMRNRSRKMAPWDEIADDAAMESDYYLAPRAANFGRFRPFDPLRPR